MEHDQAAGPELSLTLDSGGSIVVKNGVLGSIGQKEGAHNRIRTELEIGTDPALARTLQAMTQQRDAKESQLLEIGKLLSFSDRNPGRIASDVRLRAEQTAAAISRDIENMREEEAQIRHRFDLAQRARVEAEKALYEGVSVTMGEARLRIQGEHGPSTVRLAEQGLGIFLLDDDTTLDAER